MALTDIVSKEPNASIAARGNVGTVTDAVGAETVLQLIAITISRARAILLYNLYLMEGLLLGSPLSVSAASRSASGLAQTIAGSTTIIVTPTATQDFQGNSVDTLIDELAAISGISATLTVTDVSRSAGGISQTLAESAGTSTVTRNA